jgi:hypothetical protein
MYPGAFFWKDFIFLGGVLDLTPAGAEASVEDVYTRLV